MANINSDGIFIIASRDGITQGIQKELGLSNQECKQLGSVWNQIINEFDNQENMTVKNNQNATPNKSNRYLVHAGAVVEFSKECWAKIVGWINTALGKNIQVQTEEANDDIESDEVVQTNEIQPLNETQLYAHQTLVENVNKARTYLVEKLNALKEADPAELEKIGLNSAKLERILGYLDKLYFEDGDSCTMQAAPHNGSPAIFVNIKLSDSDNLINMITMLMHEANHCDEQYLSQHPEESEVGDTRHRDADGNPIPSPYPNTKQEELACETLGIKTAILLLQKYGDEQESELDKNYGRYNNHSFLDYVGNENLLNQDLQTWVHQNYANYANDYSGEMVVEHSGDLNLMAQYTANGTTPNFNEKFEIHHGDIIVINNDRFTIGVDAYIEGTMSKPVLQLHKTDGSNVGDGYSSIILNDVKPTDEELAGLSMKNVEQNERCPVVKIIRKGTTEEIDIGYVYCS